MAEVAGLHVNEFARGDMEAPGMTDGWRPGIYVGGLVLNFLFTLLLACAVIGILLFFSTMFRRAVFDELHVTLPLLTHTLPSILESELVVLLLVGAVISVAHAIPRLIFKRFPWIGILQTHMLPFGSALRLGLAGMWCDRMNYYTRRGLDVEKAVKLSADDIGHPTVERACASVLEDLRAAPSSSLATAMENESFFPEALIWSLHAGEKIGTLDHVWEPAARLYEDEARGRGRMILVLARMVLVLAVALAGVMAMIGIALPFFQITYSL